MAQPKLKAVIFDATGTLMTPHPSVGAVYAEVAARFGEPLDAATIDTRFGEDFGRALREMRQAGRPVWEAESGAWEFWRRVLDAIFLRQRRRPCPEDCFRAIYVAFERGSAWRLFPDVLPILTTLRTAGIRLGILSNFDARLHKIVQALGVREYFALVLPSTEVGFAKPRREVFEAALTRLNVRPYEALYVGDDPEADAAGASRAGMKFLLLDRRGKLATADHVIHSLAEVPPHVI